MPRKPKAELLSEILQRLKELQYSRDPEGAHTEADALLEAALLILNQREIVEAYQEVPKWYA